MAEQNEPAPTSSLDTLALLDMLGQGGLPGTIITEPVVEEVSREEVNSEDSESVVEAVASEEVNSEKSEPEPAIDEVKSEESELETPVEEHIPEEPEVEAETGPLTEEPEAEPEVVVEEVVEAVPGEPEEIVEDVTAEVESEEAEEVVEAPPEEVPVNESEPAGEEIADEEPLAEEPETTTEETEEAVEPEMVEEQLPPTTSVETPPVDEELEPSDSEIEEPEPVEVLDTAEDNFNDEYETEMDAIAMEQSKAAQTAGDGLNLETNDEDSYVYEEVKPGFSMFVTVPVLLLYLILILGAAKLAFLDAEGDSKKLTQLTESLVDIEDPQVKSFLVDKYQEIDERRDSTRSTARMVFATLIGVLIFFLGLISFGHLRS
ncbi:hypothetical protein BVY04_01540 [bacterium M21]|nr:hypothetical protein BVY04_01540 [bacterium M21]